MSSGSGEVDLVESRYRLQVAGASVPACFFVPRHLDGAAPLVVIQHAAMGSKDDYYVADAAKLWAARGWICGGFDAPYHGEREPHDPLGVLRDRALLESAASRFAGELAAIVDDLARRFPVDTARMGFVGHALGAMLGIRALGEDPRFRAAVLCLVGEGGIVGRADDAEGPVRKLAATAVRVVGRLADEVVPRASTEALHAAIPGTRDLTWLPGGHFDTGPDLLEAALDWLKRHL